MDKKEKLELKLSKLREKLRIEEGKEIAVLRNRGWGYAQRHVKLAFSTTKTDNIKERIKIVEFELKELSSTQTH